MAPIGDCERRFGPIDVLINHAGIGPSRHVLEMSEQELRTVIEVNLSGIFRVGQDDSTDGWRRARDDHQHGVDWRHRD